MLDVVHGDQVVLKRKVGVWKAALFLILCDSQVYLYCVDVALLFSYYVCPIFVLLVLPIFVFIMFVGHLYLFC